MNEPLEIFDWSRILINNWKPDYLYEVAFRTIVMFLAVLTILRLAGKRGLKQLSVFELAIIIALGSASGDPMMYPDSPILPAILNFVIVITAYRIITWIAGRSRKAEDILEGKPVCLFENGKINEKRLTIFGHDEFMAELRTTQVSHLGQVDRVYLETSGEMSVYYFEDEDVKPGLPIQPEYYKKVVDTIEVSGLHSCASCGNTLHLEQGQKMKCESCKHHTWLPSISGTRVT